MSGRLARAVPDVLRSEPQFRLLFAGGALSVNYLTTAGLMPLGVALAGPIAEAIGIHETLLMSVVGWLTALVLLAVPSVRDLGRPVSAGAP